VSRDYIPVDAKRRALSIYRDRRRNGASSLDHLPRRRSRPMTAMQGTVHYFEGHLAFAVAYGRHDDVQVLVDGFHAAEYYLYRTYDRPWHHSR
jgi:hypothetical protein